jgi:hypothetical protein
MTDEDVRATSGTPAADADADADADAPEHNTPGGRRPEPQAEDDKVYSEAEAAVRDVQEEEDRDGG